MAGALLVAQLDPGKQALRERSGGPQGAPERPEEIKKKTKKNNYKTTKSEKNSRLQKSIFEFCLKISILKTTSETAGKPVGN